ncbi:MAG: hypothetical protein RSB41_00490 [Bacilli bacterium]
MLNADYSMYQGFEVGEASEYKKTENNIPCGVAESPMCGCNEVLMPTAQVYECPVERCIHKNIVHEVKHVCPVNTRIINHHIFKHCYSPCYTSQEENTICNVDQGCCKRF